MVVKPMSAPGVDFPRESAANQGFLAAAAKARRAQREASAMAADPKKEAK